MKYAFLVQLDSRGGSRLSERGFVSINVWGLALLILSHFSYLNIPSEPPNPLWIRNWTAVSVGWFYWVPQRMFSWKHRTQTRCTHNFIVNVALFSSLNFSINFAWTFYCYTLGKMRMLTIYSLTMGKMRMLTIYCLTMVQMRMLTIYCLTMGKTRMLTNYYSTMGNMRMLTIYCFTRGKTRMLTNYCSTITPIPHRPRIAPNWFFLIRGDSWGFIKLFSLVVMFYESVPIQIRCRYEYSGESAQFDWNRARIHYD